MKASCIFGILILFLYSELFGHTDPEFRPATHVFYSQQGNQPTYFKLCSFDNPIIRTVSSLHVKPAIAIVSSTGGRTLELQVKNAEYGSGPDSFRIIRGSDSCSPGYIMNKDTSVCAGSIIEFYSRTALSYQWLPENLVSNSSIRNPYLISDTTRTYYLVTMDYTDNLVINPGYELGNTGFITGYTYCDGINCLSPLGDNGYSVGTDANYFHSYFTGNDHTTGSGNFMIINGAQPSLMVWQQTIPVKTFTKYAFGVWISTMISLRPAQIQFSINGAQIGTIINAPVYANKWEQVFATWNSGSATSATIKIVDILPVLEGNDFGLDDLFFGEIINCTDSVTVTASQNVNLGQDTIISPEQDVVFSPSNGDFEQYNWSTGDTTQFISITEAGTYWLAATDYEGCKSSDTINVKNSLSFIIFPDAFTPNADGYNDVYRPVCSNVRKFHMTVFDRWGQFLFETNEIEEGWNGIIHGTSSPAGLYVYVVTYEFQDTAGEKTKRGSFTLIR